jgi:hypothetical protein
MSRVKPTSNVRLYQSPDGEVYAGDDLFNRFLREALAIDRESYDLQAAENPTLRRYVTLAYARWLREKGFRRTGESQPSTPQGKYIVKIVF